MKGSKIVHGLLLLAFLVFWFGGLWSYTVPDEPPADARWAGPAFLWLAAALCMAGADRAERLRRAAAGGVGLIAEIAGVRVGVPFGGYEYSGALGPAGFGVPLVLAAAWIVVFSFAREMIRDLPLNRLARAAAGAALMVAVDLVIDPLAAGPLGYWSWSRPGRYYGIPFSNFAGWAVVSALLFALFDARPAPFRRWGAGGAGAAIVLFFTLLAWTRGFPLAGAIGAILCLAAGGRLITAGRARHPSVRGKSPGAVPALPRRERGT